MSPTLTGPVPPTPAVSGVDNKSVTVRAGGIHLAGPRVLGVRCKRDHFNDPRAAYCSSCGIGMTQITRRPVLGHRPSLGVLLLADGRVLPLSADHVLGRDPGQDPAVLAGRALPVRLPDPLVSRAHARVLLSGWDVVLVDSGSTNGTFVCAPGASSWTPVPRGGEVTLRPDAAVALGGHVLRYHSYRNIL